MTSLRKSSCSPSRGERRLLLGLLAATIAGAPRPAAAGDPAAAAATKEATRLLGQRKFAEACAAFAKSQQIEPSPATLLSLARCEEKADRPASAIKTYRAIVASGASGGQKAVAAAAIRALEPKAPRVVVSIAGPAMLPDLHVSLDGAPLEKAEWNRPQPVDPGPHEVTAHAHERKPFRATVTAGKGTVTVAVPPLEEDRVAAAANGTMLMPLKSIGGATWSEGVGFVLPGDAPPPLEQSMAPVLPLVRNDDLGHVSVGWDVGAVLETGAGAGVRTDVTVRPEFRRKSSWVAPWFDVRISGGYLPNVTTGFVGGGGHVGVDVHPARSTWLGFGPSVGYGTLVFVGSGSTIVDHGPEIGMLNIHFRTSETEESPPIFDACLHLDERISLENSSVPSSAGTYGGLRLGVGGHVRFRAFVEGRIVTSGLSFRTSEALFSGIGIGGAE